MWMSRWLLALTLVAGWGCARDEWAVVAEGLPGALISVWGQSADDVWTVGGDAGDGPMVLHLEGGQWQRVRTGTRGDLWWVFGFAGGPVYMGGQGGRLLRWEGGAITTIATPGMSTVFGIWGAARDDLWAVGGNGNGGAFAWRGDGTSWRAVDLPEQARDASLFKVWGRGPREVWLVGTGGLVLRWDGSAFTKEPAPTMRTLFTVHADLARAVTVGGFGSGVLLENDGGGWRDVTPPRAQQTIGVWLTGGGGYAVGTNGQVLRRGEGGWQEEPTGLDVYRDLHSVWVDPQGGVWAAGGQVTAQPLIDGLLLHRGRAAPPVVL